MQAIPAILPLPARPPGAPLVPRNPRTVPKAGFPEQTPPLTDVGLEDFIWIQCLEPRGRNGQNHGGREGRLGMLARSHGRRQFQAVVPASRVRAAGWAGLLAAAILLTSRAWAGPPVAGVPESLSVAPDTRARVEWFEDRRESTPDLLLLLADPDPAVRARAALAIGRIGRAADASPLAPLLGDPDASVRREAAFALGEMEEPSVAGVMETRLLSGLESDPETRALCAEGLGKLRSGPAGIRAALRDPEPAVVIAALHAAWQVPGTDPLAEAIDLSLGKDPGVQRAAACCLMRLLGVKPSGRTAVAEVAPIRADDRARAIARLRELASSADPQVRIYAVRGLADTVDEFTTKILAALLPDLDWRVRVEAVRALAAPGRSVSPRLLRPLWKDRNGNVRITAAEALATLGPAKDAIRRLRGLLHDPSLRMRQAAFGALLARYRASGDPIPGPAIDGVEAASLEMQGQTAWSLRALAADGAVLLPLDLALPILDRMIQDEPRVARAAVDPLLQRHARLHVGPILAQIGADLQRLLSSSDPVLRALTIESMGAIFADSTLTVDASDWMGLEMILDQSRRYSAEFDRVPDVRLAVVEAVRHHIDRPEMGRILTACANDPDYLVRRSAATAMRAAGQDPPRDPEPVDTGMSAADYEPILRWAQADHWAVFETGEGTIVVRLFTREAPLTCWNFARLAREGFFDRSRWHRVVPDFVLQAGCPRGDGYGSSDRTIRCEINEKRFVAGTLGMALSGKDTGSSQFFLTHSDQPHLDGRYTVFGQVERGAETAGRITQGANLWSIRVFDSLP
jgi:cyclophilin family peptidyl-prolyl cis-trans isomerase/HEAT repeat protein